MRITKNIIGNFEYYTTQKDKWYEWFRLEIEEGLAWRFYFPTERIPQRNTMICWVWYLVPFVLFVRLFIVAISSIYFDSRKMLNDWKKYRANLENNL